MRKVKRNTYELDAELITDQPANEPAGEITIRYVKYLEALIREQPEYWLWSHRRWKHKRPIEN
jgi:KDO2-lipid IV(A) lauroyltransferase